ncbi:MAG: hypothetical protein ACOVOW_13020 [Spirosomataceae bacterium]|jgi:hypothetical protein
MIKRQTTIFAAIGYLLVMGLLSSCSKPAQTSSYYRPNYEKGGYDAGTGFDFGGKDHYPIEILQGDDKPQTAYEELKKLSLTGEYPLTPDQEHKGRMLNRGNDEQQKRDLMKDLVAQAQDLGASGIMKVNYKVFSSATTSGFILSGVAFKYTMK